MIAIAEGFIVLGYQLVFSRVMFPYLGNSLLIWTSITGVSFLALALSYYLAGRAKNPDKLISPAFAGFAFFTGLFALAKPYLGGLMSGELTTDTLLVCFLFLFPPVSSIGLINISLARMEGKSGKGTGFVFFFSTLAGLASALVFGFLMISAGGTFLSLGMLAALAFSFLLFLNPLKNKPSLAFGTIGILLFLPAVLLENNIATEFTLLSKKEGFAGQLMVLDNNEQQTRILLINGLPQTIISKSDSTAVIRYVQNMESIVKEKAAGKNILILGLGGGTLARNLSRTASETRVVEIDGRLASAAADYFYLDTDKVEIIHDDARHYLRKDPEHYSLIISDVFAGDAVPAIMFTREAFLGIKNRLNEEGLLACYFPDAPDQILANVKASIESAGLFCRLVTSGRARSGVVFLLAAKNAETLHATDILPSHEINLTVQGRPYTDNLSTLEAELLNHTEGNNFRKTFWKSLYEKN